MRETRTSGSVRGAPSNGRPLYVAACSARHNISPSSKESGEPHASLRSTNLCGRYGPASPSSAVHAERYPGTRHAADPAYKVARRGALPCSSTIMVAKMSDVDSWNRRVQGDLGRELCERPAKAGQDLRNSPDGWKLVLAWLKAMGSKQAHVCMEATGRHSLGVALALHDAGHVVSVVNPAQIRDFARTKLGRNKTDKVDAALIREYAELFKPGPWAPPSPGDAAAVRTADHARRHRQQPGGVEEPHRQRPRRQHRDQPGRRDDRAFHRANSRQSTRPFARRSTRTTSCAADATCCSASSVSARRWPPRCWRRCRSQECCVEVARWSPMPGSTQATTGPAPRLTARRVSPRSAMPRCGRRSTCRRCRRCAIIPPSSRSSRA